MKLEEIGPFLAVLLPALGFGTIVGGTIVAFIKRGTDKDANEISEKDVNTRATSMTIEVLTEGLRELRQELSDEREKGRGRDEHIKVLREDVRTLQRDKDILLTHLEAVEALVPNPPGPPARPNFDRSLSL